MTHKNMINLIILIIEVLNLIKLAKFGFWLQVHLVGKFKYWMGQNSIQMGWNFNQWALTLYG